MSRISRSNSQQYARGFPKQVSKARSESADYDFSSSKSCKLFIGGLSYDTTNESMKEYFEQYGLVDSALVLRDPATLRSRGFGFITFNKPEFARNAVACARHIIDGRKVEAKFAVPRTAAVISSGSSSSSASGLPTVSNTEIQSTFSNASTLARKGIMKKHSSRSKVSLEMFQKQPTSPGLSESSMSSNCIVSSDDTNLNIGKIDDSPESSSCPPSKNEATFDENSTNDFSFNAASDACVIIEGMVASNANCKSILKNGGDFEDEFANKNESKHEHTSKSNKIISSMDNETFSRGLKNPDSNIGPGGIILNKIFVGGLLYATGHESLRKFFEVYGPVETAEVIYNRDTKKSRGFGFVVFRNNEPVTKVLIDQKTNVHMLNGKPVEVKRCMARQDIIELCTVPFKGSKSPLSDISTQSLNSAPKMHPIRMNSESNVSRVSSSQHDTDRKEQGAVEEEKEMDSELCAPYRSRSMPFIPRHEVENVFWKVPNPHSRAAGSVTYDIGQQPHVQQDYSPCYDLQDEHTYNNQNQQCLMYRRQVYQHQFVYVDPGGMFMDNRANVCGMQLPVVVQHPLEKPIDRHHSFSGDLGFSQNDSTSSEEFCRDLSHLSTSDLDNLGYHGINREYEGVFDTTDIDVGGSSRGQNSKLGTLDEQPFQSVLGQDRVPRLEKSLDKEPFGLLSGSMNANECSSRHESPINSPLIPMSPDDTVKGRGVNSNAPPICGSPGPVADRTGIWSRDSSLQHVSTPLNPQMSPKRESLCTDENFNFDSCTSFNLSDAEGDEWFSERRISKDNYPSSQCCVSVPRARSLREQLKGARSSSFTATQNSNQTSTSPLSTHSEPGLMGLPGNNYSGIILGIDLHLPNY